MDEPTDIVAGATGTRTSNVHSISERFTQAASRGDRTIQIRPDALHLIATEGENALLASNAPIYVRGGLVKPVVDVVPASHGHTAKVARLCDVEADCLIDFLSRAAGWIKYSFRAKDWKPTDPPRNVALTIMAREGEWRFKRLSGVITTPTIGPNGTILAAAGYDEATQLLLLEPPALPKIPDAPSKQRAQRALAFLQDLLAEFPFANEASHAAALSALITPIVRGGVPVAPMHVTTAPVAGSGKSYIIDLASAMATGERAPVLAAGRTEEETEKRLGAALLNGQAIITIDNVNGDLGGDLLCQMIERPVVSIRPLGSSKLVKIETRATVFATGNNIRMLGDMTRRVVVCSLDPNMERPELRQFEKRPFDLVVSNRGKYIAAVLTIVRAYAAAGYPDQCPALASFGDWSRVVRSALVWLGCADPVNTMAAARDDDPNTSTLRTLLHSWKAAMGTGLNSCATAVERANAIDDMNGGKMHPDLLHALGDIAEGKRGELSTRRLGKYLLRNKGRIIDGLKFTDAIDNHANTKLWKVEQVE